MRARMIALARIVLFGSAIVFVGIGVAFVAAPAGYASVVEIAAPTAVARTELRATFGGLELGFGLFLGLCAIRSGWMIPGLAALGLALGGFAGARLIGMLVEGTASRLMLIFETLEVATAALAFYLMHGLSRTRATVDGQPW